MGVAVRWTEKIQGGGGLVDESVPDVQWEVGVDAGETGDEVVLPRSDGFFCRVGAMVMGGDELVVDFVFGHEGC